MAVLLVFARAAKAQTDVPRPQAGKSIRLMQKHTKIQPTKDGPFTMVAEVPITVTVVQADAQRTVIRWQRGVLKFTDVDSDIVRRNPTLKPMLMQAAIAQAGPLVSAMDNLAFDVIFSPKWDYLGLANFDEALAAARKSVDAMDEMRRKAGNPPLPPNAREMILSRKVIEQVFPKDALTFLAGQTYAVRRGTTAAFTGAMPNPVGADPIPSQVNVTFDQANDANGHAVIRTSSTGSMGALVDSIKQNLAKTPGATPMPADTEKQLRETKMEWNAEYRIDPTTGLPSWVKQTATAGAAGSTLTEEFLWMTTSGEK